MREKRPFALTVVGWLIIAGAVSGLVRGFAETKTFWPVDYDLLTVVVVDVAGVIFGVFLLRGSNWARWLTLVWLAFHVGLGFFISAGAAVAHSVIFAMLAYLLVFRADVRSYFAVSR
jgi:hypothetical protein